MKTVISTLEADTAYTEQIRDTVRRVLVRGHTIHRPGFLAPTTTSTALSDDDAAFLASHKQFQAHQVRGFVRIIENGDTDDGRPD